jgi:Icc-related predicted phosphoesterase
VASGAVDAAVAPQVGDLCHDDHPGSTRFVAGNNEDLDVIEALHAGRRPEGVQNAHLLASEVVDHDGCRIAGASGTFASTQFEKALDGDRRQHFVADDVERACASTDVAVLLAHDPPHGLIQRGGDDIDCKQVDAILEAVEPERCPVGHHHEHAESTFGPTRETSPAPVSESVYALDSASLHLERRPEP